MSLTSLLKNLPPLYKRDANSINYKVMSAVGSVIDTLLSDSEEAKNESYVGVVPLVITDRTSNGPIGLAKATVDVAYLFNIDQQTPGRFLFLPVPTSYENGRYVVVFNTGTTSFTMLEHEIIPGAGVVFLRNTSSFGNYWSIANLFLFIIPVNYPTVSVTIPDGNFDISNPLSKYALVISRSNIARTVYGKTLQAFSGATLLLWTGKTWVPATSNEYGITPTGASGSFLDSVGLSYGVERTLNESDGQFKLRIKSLVVGNKAVPLGIAQQISVVYGFQPEIFDWYPDSYAQLLAILTPNYAAFAIPSGANVTIDLSASAGPPFTFYVVVPASVLNKFTSGVYAGSDTPADNIFPSAFYDWQDPAIGVERYGGFYVGNPGEITVDVLQKNRRIMQIVERVKASGTNGVLVVQDAL